MFQPICQHILPNELLLGPKGDAAAERVGEAGPKGEPGPPGPVGIGGIPGRDGFPGLFLHLHLHSMYRWKIKYANFLY